MTSSATKTKSDDGKSGHHICRLCMGKQFLEDVFSSEVGLHQLISDYLSIMITTEDNMSQMVCSLCRMWLTEFHQFRVRCREVQDLLQSRSVPSKDGVGTKMDPDGTDSPLKQTEDPEQNHNHKILQCEMCDKVFNTKKQLSAHKKDHAEKLYQKVPSQNKLVKVKTEPCEETAIDIYEDSEMQGGELESGAIHSPCGIEDMIDIEEVKIETHDEYEIPSKASDDSTDKGCSLNISKNDTKDIGDITAELPTDLENEGSNMSDEVLFVSDDHSSDERVQPEKKTSEEFPNRTDEKPYKCDICQKAYSIKKVLWNHKKTVHESRNYECHLCGYKFSFRYLLGRHLRSHSRRGDSKDNFKPVRRVKSKQKVKEKV